MTYEIEVAAQPHRAIAVRRWCTAQSRDLTGERWEVYGDWREDPSLLETEIFYRLTEASELK
jgi:hypothetical protein